MNNPHILNRASRVFAQATVAAAVLAFLFWTAGLPLLAQNDGQAKSKTVEKQPAGKQPSAQPADSGMKPAVSPPKPGQAAKPPEVPTTHAPEALALLRKAREAVSADRSLQATIEETITIGGRRMLATGTYAHAPFAEGSLLKLRLELVVTMGTAKDPIKTSLLQVCNGQVLYTSYDLGGRKRLTRRNVAEIVQKATESGVNNANVLIADLGLGGLPAMLASMERVMVFTVHKQLSSNGGKSLVVIEGTWNDMFTSHWQGISKRATGDPNSYPEFVPERIRVYFDTNHLPRRVMYLKKRRGQDSQYSMLTLDFKDIKLGGDVDEKQFTFKPPAGYIADRTKQYTDRFVRTGPARP